MFDRSNSRTGERLRMIHRHIDLDNGTEILPGMVLHYADPRLPAEPCVVIMVLTARESIVFSTLGRADGAARRISVDVELAIPRLHRIIDCSWARPGRDGGLPA